MGKKCPPGVICFENITIIFIVIIILIVGFFVNKRTSERDINTSNNLSLTPSYGLSNLSVNPSYGLSNITSDVLLNPYQPPLRDDRVGTRTKGYDSEYRQIGILTRHNGSELILPLMGIPIHVARDKWNFYTMKDSNSMIKLPITYKGKSCTSEYGCDNLYSGEYVYVEGYKDTFLVTVYDNQVSRYNPHV